MAVLDRRARVTRTVRGAVVVVVVRRVVVVRGIARRSCLLVGNPNCFERGRESRAHELSTSSL